MGQFGQKSISLKVLSLHVVGVRNTCYILETFSHTPTFNNQAELVGNNRLHEVIQITRVYPRVLLRGLVQVQTIALQKETNVHGVKSASFLSDDWRQLDGFRPLLATSGYC